MVDKRNNKNIHISCCYGIFWMNSTWWKWHFTIFACFVSFCSAVSVHAKCKMQIFHIFEELYFQSLPLSLSLSNIQNHCIALIWNSLECFSIRYAFTHANKRMFNLWSFEMEQTSAKLFSLFLFLSPVSFSSVFPWLAHFFLFFAAVNIPVPAIDT